VRPVVARWLKWTLGIAAGGICVLAAAFVWMARPAHITALAQSNLAERLRMDVEVGEVTVRFWPRPSVQGRDLAVRIPGQPGLPPLIAIEEFSMNIGPFSIMRKQVDTVFARGLRISVPPGDVRDEIPGPAASGEPTEIIIKHFITEDGSLQFIPRDPAKKPLTFAIHNLHVRNVGFGLRMPFEAVLTNPLPTGLVQAEGELGPWLRDDVVQSPLSGHYVFTDADLATINGIGGTLQSTGIFSGTIRRIEATGDARVPDFSLELGGRPMPLAANFAAVVTGTDGTTVIERADAVLGETKITVTGAVINQAGPGNRDLEFNVEIADGRIEDILALVIDAPQPIMTGTVDVTGRMTLPPGETPVRHRLSVEGRFGLAQTRFTDRGVQEKMNTLSRRGQGKDDDDPLGRVMTNLRGQVRLANGVARFSQLTFQVPGAHVGLNGSYGLESGTLNFRGSLRMQASISDAVGGFKSIFLKPFNGIFRKDGAGAVVPIKIEGTRDEPKFGVEFGRIF
jgi:hypothetical protein